MESFILHFIFCIFNYSSPLSKRRRAAPNGSVSFRLSQTGYERKIVRNLTIIVAFVALASFTNPVAAQDKFRISDDTLFRARGGAGLFVTGNTVENQNSNLPDRGRKSDALTLWGEGSGYWIFGRDSQKSEFGIGVSGGFLNTRDNDGVVPPDPSPRTLDYRLAYGAASFIYYNRRARYVQTQTTIDLGAAYRDLFTHEAMAFGRLESDTQFFFGRPLGLYTQLGGLLAQGKSERYRRQGRLGAGLVLWQATDKPEKFHFRYVMIGGFVGLKYEKDRDTPVKYREERFMVGPRVMLDFGPLTANIEVGVPGSKRELTIQLNDVENVSKDRSARPLDIQFSLTLFF